MQFEGRLQPLEYAFLDPTLRNSLWSADTYPPQILKEEVAVLDDVHWKDW